MILLCNKLYNWTKLLVVLSEALVLSSPKLVYSFYKGNKLIYNINLLWGQFTCAFIIKDHFLKVN